MGQEAKSARVRKGVFGTRARVCVIGAGPSGIAAAKAVRDEGYDDVVLYDRGKVVGGNWVFDADSGHSSVFETTHIISSKHYSEYDDYPMPADYPDYPSHRLLAAYFQGYARHFGIDRCVEYETMVERCERTADQRWAVTTTHAGATKTEVFDVLVVANGHHWKPRWPSYQGTFTGTYIHSHDFKRAGSFAGQRVLVIGGGNSACDCAVETSRVSARTDLSWRRGYWIVPKFLFGKPGDHLHNEATRHTGKLVPSSVRLRALEALLRTVNGSNASYGLPEPDHHLGETHPTLNSELLYFIRHGEIHPRPDIARFDGKTVTFTDGTKDDYDTIIACTGFEIAHPFFAPDLVDYSRATPPLYLKMIPERFDDLYFVGLFQPLGCIWPAAALQAKVMARRMRGLWSPPEDLAGAIAREVATPDVKQIASPRHTITVDAPLFRERLLAQLPRDFVRREPPRTPARVDSAAL